MGKNSWNCPLNMCCYYMKVFQLSGSRTGFQVLGRLRHQLWCLFFSSGHDDSGVALPSGFANFRHCSLQMIRQSGLEPLKNLVLCQNHRVIQDSVAGHRYELHKRRTETKRVYRYKNHAVPDLITMEVFRKQLSWLFSDQKSSWAYTHWSRRTNIRTHYRIYMSA